MSKLNMLTKSTSTMYAELHWSVWQYMFDQQGAKLVLKLRGSVTGVRQG